MTVKKKPTFYIKNSLLLKEILASKEIQEKYPERKPSECLTPELVEMITTLIENYSKHDSFRNYTYIEDMKGEACVILCQNALKFNPERSSNPFAYYTQIIKNSFRTELKKEKNIRDIKDKLLESQGFNPSYTKQLENEFEFMESREYYNEDVSESGYELDGTKRVPSEKRKGRYASQ